MRASAVVVPRAPTTGPQNPGPQTPAPAPEEGRGRERTVTLRKRFTGGTTVLHNNQRVVPAEEERVDALLQHIAGLDVPSVRYMAGQFVPDFDTPVSVADGITARVVDKKEAEGDLTSITVTLSSTRRTVSGIRAFLEDCFHNYRALINNQLGDKLFVFEHTAIVDQCAPRQARFKGEPTVHPPRIRFTKHPFESARSLDNVYFGDMPRLRNRLRHFRENRPWYEERGIPYTFGLLMHGIPGAGKTSTIKAIANYMDRHIVNVKLGEVKTKTQLHGLFFDERMRVAGEEAGMPGQDQTFTIPVARRLYVLEDVDCMDSPVVLSRELKADRERQAAEAAAVRMAERAQVPGEDGLSRLQSWRQSLQGLPGPGAGRQAPQDPRAQWGQESMAEMGEEPLADTSDELDLSTLLNCLDGTLESPGRMVIMTSNHPETLDAALTRKGRIDMHIELGHATGEIVRQMFSAWYGQPWPEGAGEPREGELTPADVGSVLFDYLDDPGEAVAELSG